MKLKSFLQNALLLSMVLLGFSCNSEPENQQGMLLGRWELKEATRNGNPTESLSDLYFVFNADGSMNTNLPVPGMMEETRYKLDGSTIYQYSDSLPDEVNYHIDKIEDSTLVLSTELRNFHFSFVLHKQAATESAQ
ncbi:MAG: lipocalin family protein [Phaeodactylibacter sp.]|nr:lipocalin family protein [Phaeodactylibacter sp.]MCB9266145.1 lipocalin family protein [Lewinellaceae bacterium]MCB9286279.1 lipocalin family protein [Lewinellaceae bacterium]